jgi:hypothetical protein
LETDLDNLPKSYCFSIFYKRAVLPHTSLPGNDPCFFKAIVSEWSGLFSNESVLEVLDRSWRGTISPVLDRSRWHTVFLAKPMYSRILPCGTKELPIKRLSTIDKLRSLVKKFLPVNTIGSRGASLLYLDVTGE